MAFSIEVTANGTYNTFDGDNSHVIRGGYNIIKIAGTLSGATITPQCDFGDGGWAGLLNNDGTGIRTITVEGIQNLQPLKSGMRLRFVVSGAGSPNFTIKGL